MDGGLAGQRGRALIRHWASEAQGPGWAPPGLCQRSLLEPHPQPGCQASNIQASFASACCSNNNHWEGQQRHWLFETLLPSCSRGTPPLPGPGNGQAITQQDNWAAEGHLRKPPGLLPPKVWRGRGCAAAQWVRDGGCAFRGWRPWGPRSRQGWGEAGEADLRLRPSLPKGRFRIEHEQSVSLNINRAVV